MPSLDGQQPLGNGPLYVAIPHIITRLLLQMTNILSLQTYPSESHRVKGHSHMPAKSGFDMSLAMNCSGERPGRFSHSGTYPASGATRFGGSIVLLRAEEDALVETDVNPRAAGADVAKAIAARESFILCILLLGG